MYISFIIFHIDNGIITARFIQVPNDLLDCAMKGGTSMAIVGNKGCEAVLVTEQKSYALKRVETSNSGTTVLSTPHIVFMYKSYRAVIVINLCIVFFVPPTSGTSFAIESTASDYFEVMMAYSVLFWLDFS